MEHIKKIWQYFRKYKFYIVISIIAAFGFAASNASMAYLVKPALDDVFINKDEKMLQVIPALVVLAIFSKGATKFTQNFLMRRAGQWAIMDIRNELYNKLIVLPLGFYSKNSTGVLMSRITNDVNMMLAAIPSFVNSIRDIITLIGLLGVVLYMDYKLAIYSFITLPFIAFLIVFVGKKMKKYSKKKQEKMGNMATVLQETFSGIRVIKAFTTEEKEKEKFAFENSKYVKYEIKRIMISELSSPINEFLGAIGIALVIFYGGYQVINGQSTAGTFMAFLAAILMMYEPFKKLDKSNQAIQAAIGASERVFDFIETHNEILAQNGTKECDANAAGIRFENVTFKYEDTTILDTINLDVKHGEQIALVGASGAGKSTLVNLIPRFYDTASGSIQIDGIDVKDFNVYSLRNNIGIVSQEPFLFNDTIKNNIAYSMQTYTDEQIYDAAKAAFAHDFIESLPEGYETVIGERGVKLSGGQKQRITIARALLANPPILILDEATSALDTESEKIVQKALDNLMAGRTSFVIAHRLSTILNSDRIVVMDQGEIEAVGPHNDVLKKSKTYAKLFNMQFNTDQ